MAKTDWKSSIKTDGTVVAGYYSDVNGTVYMLMQGLGTAYKMAAGTAVLAAGSAHITTGLSSLVSVVARCAYHLGTAGVGTYAGTIPVNAVFITTAGTVGLVSAPAGVAALGTAYVSWQAVGT
jgi:hypothetical protein